MFSVRHAATSEIQGKDTDPMDQKGVDKVIRIHTAAAVAMQVYHTWHLPFHSARPIKRDRKVVAAHNLHVAPIGKLPKVKDVIKST